MANEKLIRYTFEGLENGKTYYVRVYPKNPDKEYQSELDGQVVSAVPTEE